MLAATAFAVPSSRVAPNVQALHLQRPACAASRHANKATGSHSGRVALRAACAAGAAIAVRSLRRAPARTRSLQAQPESKTEVAEEEPFFEEVRGDDPIVLDLEERLRKMNGDQSLTLDMVLNPGSIVNAEREVIRLRAELALTPQDDTEQIKVLEDKIEEKQMKIVNEMRQVMTDSLKLEFLLQGVLSVPAFALMTYDAFPFVPDLTFFEIPEEGSRFILEIFGVWGIWLLTIPALRARKPGGPYGMGYEEKRALDIAFLLTPLLCIGVPFVSSYPPVTFWACLIALGACYAWSFSTPLDGEDESKVDLPEPVRWALKSLDYSSGKERGAVREDDTWQEKMQNYEKVAQEIAAERSGGKASTDGKKEKAEVKESP